jgi:hypothetical protein
MIVDRYIKMTWYISISKTLTAMQLADIFFEKIVCHYRTLKEIVSDRGSIFTSSYWSEVCYQVKIKRQLSTTFHSQMNRQTEHQNQTLKHYLQCYCNEEQSNWVKLLSLAKFVYINTKQSTLRCSLFYVMTGIMLSFIMTLRTTSEKKRCLQLRTESSNYTKLMKSY